MAFVLLFALGVPSLMAVIVILPVVTCSLFSWFAMSAARVRSVIATLCVGSIAGVVGTLICPAGYLILSLVGQPYHAQMGGLGYLLIGFLIFFSAVLGGTFAATLMLGFSRTKELQLSSVTYADQSEFSNPYKPSIASSVDQPPSQRFRKTPLAVWWIGYALQFALFAGFIESWNSGRVFFNSRSDDLKLLLFGCPIVICGLISVLAILLMMKHLTTASRIWLAIGSMVLFGVTWFGFWIYLLSNLYSRMGQIR